MRVTLTAGVVVLCGACSVSLPQHRMIVSAEAEGCTLTDQAGCDAVQPQLFSCTDVVRRGGYDGDHLCDDDARATALALVTYRAAFVMQTDTFVNHDSADLEIRVGLRGDDRFPVPSAFANGGSIATATAQGFELVELTPAAIIDDEGNDTGVREGALERELDGIIVRERVQIFPASTVTLEPTDVACSRLCGDCSSTGVALPIALLALAVGVRAGATGFRPPPARDTAARA